MFYVHVSYVENLYANIDYKYNTDFRLILICLPNNKSSDKPKFIIAFPGDEMNVSQIEIHFLKDKQKCGGRRKCWLPAFSPFPTMFS